MAKYDFSFKLAVVKAYLNGEGGAIHLSRRFNIASDSTIRKWVNAYQAFGEKGLERKWKNKTYTVQFKLDVLNYKLRTGKSYQNAAIAYGLHNPDLIVSWMLAWRKEGIKGLSKSKGRPPMSKKKKKRHQSKKNLTREEELERENELLRAENAYLKKLRALGVDIPSRLRKQNHELSRNSEKNSD